MAGGGDGAAQSYEQIREQRIKENMARMQNLGIFDLSKQLKPSKPSAPKRAHQPKTHNPVSPRRSSRLRNVEPVNYDQRFKNPDKPSFVRTKRPRNPSNGVRKPPGRRRYLDSDPDSDSDSDSEVEFSIPNSGYPPRRSSRLKNVPEVKYVKTSPIVEIESSDSDADESSESTWSLKEEGYGEEVEDGTCHQCGQKTLGKLTHCSKCEMVQGQFCGDCLNTGYGETVIEANQNPDWVCPVCRGICDCGVCLEKKDNIKEEREEVYYVRSDQGSEDLANVDSGALSGEDETKEEEHFMGEEEMEEVDSVGSKHVDVRD